MNRFDARARPAPVLRQPRRPGRQAFTLVEVMIGAGMSAVILVAILFALISLQHSYSASEEFATGQADQARLLDYLALDLRRGIPLSTTAPPYAMDPDGQGLKITVPDYYQFSASDSQHLFPLGVRPTYDPTTQTAYYNGSAAPVPVGTTPCQVIAYRFNAADGSITRNDPWQPLLPNGGKTYAVAGPVVIASNMAAFPTITPDPADISGNTVHYSVTFHSIFTPLTNTATGAAITLSNVTFIRSKNLAH